MPSPQLVYVVYLMWYDVSTSKCHLQAGGIKYIKEMNAIINMFTVWQPQLCFPSQQWLHSRSQWPRRLRRGSAAARLLGLWVRIPLEAWMFVFCECCELSGRSLCVGLITHPEESYRVWCVWVWSWIFDHEEALVQWGLSRHGKKKSLHKYLSQVTALNSHFATSAVHS